MSMQQLYRTLNSPTSYSDIQYSKYDLYTFAMAVEKKMQYVLYTNKLCSDELYLSHTQLYRV